MSIKNSVFSTLWIDKEDIDEKLDQIAKVHGNKVAEKLRGFIQDGFMILEGAVSEAATENYNVALNNLLSTRDDIKVSLGREIQTNSEFDIAVPLTKILDTHVLLKEAEPLSFNEELCKYLNLIFEAKPLAFQSLFFNVGSTQAIHQDTAYVVVDQPLNLAASWIALEDVAQGSGELQYIPGSHRFPDYLYSDHFRHWSPERDGDALHEHHLHWLKDFAKQNSLEIVSFLPKRGDILIWHADLAHGGAPIINDSTRRSLVTHYCGANCTPHYFQYLDVPRQLKIPCNRGFVSSFYYDLSKTKK